jgi:hypothetical protein
LAKEWKHLRFKNINLSYTLPKFKNNAGFEKMTVFVTGYNLFVIKDYKEEFDPQNTSSVGWYYPQTKSLTFGVNITL